MPIARDINGALVQAMRLDASQNVAVASASGQSAALPAGCTVVRIVSTVDTRIAVGANPTALATSPLLPANTVEYFGVPEGCKIALLRNGTTDGTASVTAC